MTRTPPRNFFDQVRKGAFSDFCERERKHQRCARSNTAKAPPGAFSFRHELLRMPDPVLDVFDEPIDVEFTEPIPPDELVRSRE